MTLNWLTDVFRYRRHGRKRDRGKRQPDAAFLNDSGIVGRLTVTPYYNRPTQERFARYRHREHTDLPQILYNAVPYRLRYVAGKPVVWRK